MFVRLLIGLPLLFIGAFFAKGALQNILVISSIILMMSGMCTSCRGGSCEVPMKK